MNNDILFPLRKLHGKLHDNVHNYIEEKKRRYNLKRYLRYPRGQKVYIVGSPVYTNLGDSAILIAQIEFLKRTGIPGQAIKEITYREYYQDRDLIKKCIKSNNLICGMGGGNMGNQWYKEEQFRYDVFEDFPDNPIIIFPQTIYFTTEEKSVEDKKRSVRYYDTRKELTLVAREQVSYQYMKELYPRAKVILTPDIVLSANRNTFHVGAEERKEVLLCIRSDVEKTVSEEEWAQIEERLDALHEAHRRMDMYSNYNVTKENRRELVSDKMREFASAKLVITDRLHGMVFAAITGTPCLVFSNYNQKVLGTYEWIRHLPYIRFVDNACEAKALMEQLLDCKDTTFDNKELLLHFNKLEERIKQYGIN